MPKDGLARSKTRSSPRHLSINQLLHEWGIMDDPLIHAAYQVGGINRHPIYRIYLKIGSTSTFLKMSQFVEDQLMNQILQVLRCEFAA